SRTHNGFDRSVLNGRIRLGQQRGTGVDTVHHGHHGRVKSLHRLVPSRLRTQNARACLSPMPLQATPAEATWSGTARVAFRENAHTIRPATQTDNGPMLLLGY